MMRSAFILLVGLVLAAPTQGGEVEFLITAIGTTGDTGEAVEVEVTLDVVSEPILAWSIAVCHDRDVVTLDGVVNGRIYDTVNDGDTPDFDEIVRYEDGFVAGVIICNTSCAELAVGDGYQLYVVTYILDGLSPSTTEIEFCDDTLGALNNEVVIEGGASVSPDTLAGELEIVGPDPLYFDFSTVDTTVYYDVFDGIAIFEQPFRILEDVDNPEYPNAIESFTFAISNLDTLLVPTLAAPGSELAGVNDGAGPDLFVVDFVEGGIVIDVVVADLGPSSLTADELAEVIVVTYEINSTLFQTGPISLTTNLTITDELLGETNGLASGDFLVGISGGVGMIAIEAREIHLRGDVNDDGTVDFDDAIGLLASLFSGGPTILCSEAADATDEGSVDIGDAIYLLAFLFLDGEEPPPPYPFCDFDGGEVSPCGRYDSCP